MKKNSVNLNNQTEDTNASPENSGTNNENTTNNKWDNNDEDEIEINYLSDEGIDNDDW